MEQIDGKDFIVPVEKYGVKLLSIGFFVDPASATVWRGPMASNALKQMVEQGFWDELDYMLIDLPPGTSDIHLTLVQTVALTGAIVVSTPQQVALADAIKGINMFESPGIQVPVLGLVENMAWFTPIINIIFSDGKGRNNWPNKEVSGCWAKYLLYRLFVMEAMQVNL